MSSYEIYCVLKSLFCESIIIDFMLLMRFLFDALFVVNKFCKSRLAFVNLDNEFP